MTVESVRHVRCSGTGAKGCDCRIAVVSEVGASVYSVSSLADKEYPGYLHAVFNTKYIVGVI